MAAKRGRSSSTFLGHGDHSCRCDIKSWLGAPPSQVCWKTILSLRNMEEKTVGGTRVIRWKQHPQTALSGRGRVAFPHNWWAGGALGAHAPPPPKLLAAFHPLCVGGTV